MLADFLQSWTITGGQVFTTTFYFPKFMVATMYSRLFFVIINVWQLLGIHDPFLQWWNPSSHQAFTVAFSNLQCPTTTKQSRLVFAFLNAWRQVFKIGSWNHERLAFKTTFCNVEHLASTMCSQIFSTMVNFWQSLGVHDYFQ
jgi:hypothetical protein